MSDLAKAMVVVTAIIAFAWMLIPPLQAMRPYYCYHKQR